jgi:RNA polymerase-binding transcription factor DksA
MTQLSQSSQRPPAISPQDLARWKARLLVEQRRISGDLDALALETAPTEHISVSSNHLAEGASDAQDQDMQAQSTHEDHQLLQLIERALAKIDSGKPVPFGICEWNKQPISRERLELLPWTPLSSEGAEYMETSGLQIDDMLERE